MTTILMFPMPSHLAPSQELMDLAYKLTYEKTSVNDWTGPECRALLGFLNQHIGWITVDQPPAAGGLNKEE